MVVQSPVMASRFLMQDTEISENFSGMDVRCEIGDEKCRAGNLQ
ncbi:MAG: hypothetical protein P8075_09745 [Deltaproteobacteria bacterium]